MHIYHQTKFLSSTRIGYILGETTVIQKTSLLNYRNQNLHEVYDAE